MPPRLTMRKKMLGSHLRRLRETAGKTVDEVAELMNVSRAVAYRQESGLSPVSLSEAEKYVRLYGVADQVLANRIIDLARTSKSTGWWTSQPDIAGSMQGQLAEMEDMAYELWTHENQVVPALIQTDQYSEALIRATVTDERSSEAAKALIKFRARRRSVMKRNVRGRFHFSFHELAMHDWGGDREIFLDQVRYLKKLMVQGHDIRMLPFQAGWSTRPQNVLLVSSDRRSKDRIAFVDGFPNGAILHDRDAINAITSMFATLERNSLNPLDTAAWLTDTFNLD